MRMAEKKKSWFRKIIGWLHLWLGLTSGLVVFIIAVTGCLYAFQDEIQNAIQPYRFTVAQDKPVLPPSQLKAIAEKNAHVTTETQTWEALSQSTDFPV